MKDEMEAGWQLDKRIAEEVMGFQLLRTGGTAEKPIYWFSDGETEYGVGAPTYITTRWTPSTSIADAMMIVEKLWPDVQGGGYGTFRFQLCRRDGDNQWECRFAVDPNGDFSTHAVGDGETAPLAICRAALVAVKEKG